MTDPRWVLALLVACAPAPQRAGAIDPGGPVSFTVDEVAVPTAALDALIRRIPREQARSLGEDRRTTEFVEHVALTQGLYRKALDAGLDHDPEVQLALAMAEREFLASEYLRRTARATVTPEVVAQRYSEMAELRIPQLRVRHLKLGGDADPADLREQIAASSFDTVARAASADDSTRAAGGDLGWLDRSVVEGAFGPEVAAAGAGTVVGPVMVSGEPHLVAIEARRDAIPLAEIEAGLTAALIAEEEKRLTDQTRAELVVRRP